MFIKRNQIENFTDRVMAACVGMWTLINNADGAEVKVSIEEDGYAVEFWDTWGGDDYKPHADATLICDLAYGKQQWRVQFKRFDEMVNWLASEFSWPEDNARPMN